MDLHITVLFDNYVNSQKKGLGLEAMWGFSAFIQFNGKKILFDTGSNGRVLKHNAQKLNIDLSQAQYLFISHPHWDHIGGWDTVLEENPDIHIIVPASLSTHLIADLSQITQVTVVDDEPLVLDDQLYSTGIMQPEGEQALVLDTAKGLVIVAGCSHPGIENFMQRAKSILPGKPIFYVIGGFHLLHHTEKQIYKVLEKFDTKYITPTHCTGQLATEIIRMAYGDRFIEGGVGMQLNLADLP